jgi:hypothetical protein
VSANGKEIPEPDLRDLYAMFAMQQFMAMISDDPRDTMQISFDIANMSYLMADEMMKARKQHD